MSLSPSSALVASIFAASVALGAAACSSSSPSSSATEDGPAVSLGDGGFVDAAPPEIRRPPIVDGGYQGADGSVVRVDRFATQVVTFTPGDCAGFGLPNMPGVVLGPPVGAGALAGSFDVVSLGLHGEIVVGFGDNAIVDGPGPDFIVFENAFYAGGNADKPAADLGEVSVSEDGATWLTFPCVLASAPPFGACAGWRPVMSSPDNDLSPFDPATAGGEAYDLASVGLAKARFVRVRDMGTSSCPATPPKPTNYGFDLDAVAIVNAALP